MTKDTLESFSNKINSKFFFDYDLKKSNWFNIGGKAKGYFKPDTLDDLVLFLKKPPTIKFMTNIYICFLALLLKKYLNSLI